MKFTIVKKIAAPLFLILFLMVLMAIASLIVNQRAVNSIEEMEKEIAMQAVVANAQVSLATLLMDVNDYIITGRKDDRIRYQKSKENLNLYINELAKFPMTSKENNRLANIRILVQNVNEVAREIFEIEHVQGNPHVAALMEKMDYEYGDRVSQLVDQELKKVKGMVRQASISAQEDRRSGTLVVVGSSVIAFTISIAVVILIIKKISRPILSLVQVAQKIAARDFLVKMQAETKDEIGMLIIAFNVMAEEISRRYEELENFAYIVAHDLKTPIVGMRGMSEILIADYKDKLGAEAREYLELILSSSDRMSQLINDLLTFAKAGKVEYAKEPVPAGKIVNEVQTDLAFYLKERNATLTVQQNLPAIMCDPVRFSQIWKNLISNAVKYNESAAPHIEIGFTTIESGQPHYRFFVKDNGIGIDEKQVEKIFMPFQRATSDPKYEGTGIGLAIVKRVIELHGGKVWVESAKEEGTIFYFTVPKPIVYMRT